jgi:2-keto-4-pentenoate hydratase/2-oxohepta-3-ene-1,7-dioic acid hydratase in catechol pathway
VSERLARIATPAGPVAVAWRDGQWVGIYDPFADVIRLTGSEFGTQVSLLAPCEPRVILGMAHNGPGDRVLPPQAFLKSARTAVGPGGTVRLDPRVGTVHAEGELAIVIGRTARQVCASEVADVVLGYTIANDVTAIDQVALDGKMTQAKNGDGFTPIGPWITTDLDWRNVEIDVVVNGEQRAHGVTSDLAYDIVEQIVYLSSIMTLGPGDVILTGAPGTATPVELGDEVAITLGGIGTLRNSVERLHAPGRSFPAHGS